MSWAAASADSGADADRSAVDSGRTRVGSGILEARFLEHCNLYSSRPSMRAVDLIRQKRDGGALGRAEIDFIVRGVTDGTIPDYQAAALLMAIVLRGMTPAETAALTDAMVRSGVRVEYPDLEG